MITTASRGALDGYQSGTLPVTRRLPGDRGFRSSDGEGREQEHAAGTHRCDGGQAARVAGTLADSVILEEPIIEYGQAVVVGRFSVL
jgi:hypothetical protein